MWDSLRRTLPVSWSATVPGVAMSTLDLIKNGAQVRLTILPGHLLFRWRYMDQMVVERLQETCLIQEATGSGLQPILQTMASSIVELAFPQQLADLVVQEDLAVLVDRVVQGATKVNLQVSSLDFQQQ